MRNMCLIALCFAVTSYCGQIAVNPGSIPEKAGGWLSYYDGTPCWLTWSGTYRGVWFNGLDFGVSPYVGVELTQAEFWFFHDESYPWDISDVYLEVWDGDAMGPTALVEYPSMVTALHYAPVYVEYNPGITTCMDFWALVNTEMSNGGWPSTLGDGLNPTGEFHSFYSNDFIAWEPWDIGGACNFFISVYCTSFNTLNPTSWGALKTAF